MSLFRWTYHSKFAQKLSQGTFPPSIMTFHENTKQRLEIAAHAFECLKTCLPPNQTQEFPFRCSLNSFLAQCKSAIDSLAEEINLLYNIDPISTKKGKYMSIGKLTSPKNQKLQKKLVQQNKPLLNEILNYVSCNWYKDLAELRNKEAIHGVLAGKNWHLFLGSGPPTKILGIRTVSDLATWCPSVLGETNNFLERCYQLMC